MVVAGDDRYKANPVGRVLRVMPKKGKVIVEGMNVCKKHVRPNTAKSPQGGIIEKEMPIDISNVMPVIDGKPTRVRFEKRPDGSKVRIAVRSGAVLGPALRKTRA
jgi:large subunit ribosomal protein L24